MQNPYKTLSNFTNFQVNRQKYKQKTANKLKRSQPFLPPNPSSCHRRDKMMKTGNNFSKNNRMKNYNMHNMMISSTPSTDFSKNRYMSFNSKAQSNLWDTFGMRMPQSTKYTKKSQLNKKFKKQKLGAIKIPYLTKRKKKKTLGSLSSKNHRFKKSRKKYKSGPKSKIPSKIFDCDHPIFKT